MAGRGVDIKLGGTRHAGAGKKSKLGGLFVWAPSGTKRAHRQCAGARARQGDPGETQFCFARGQPYADIRSGFHQSLMGRFGIPEDEPIQNSMVSRALETRRQK